MQGKNRLFRRVDPARRGRPFCYPPSEGLGEVVCPNNNEQPAAHTSPNSRADRLLPSFGGAGGGGLPLQLATKHSSLLIPFLPFKPFLSPLHSESGKAERSPWEVELAKLQSNYYSHRFDLRSSLLTLATPISVTTRPFKQA